MSSKLPLLQQQHRHVLTGAAAQTAGLSDRARKQIGFWLAGCSGWVFSMVVLGGMTRLTRSGLSMTDWKFTGEASPQSLVHIRDIIMHLCLYTCVKDPLYMPASKAAMSLYHCSLSWCHTCQSSGRHSQLNIWGAAQADWEAEFNKYKQSPEYRKVNR